MNVVDAVYYLATNSDGGQNTRYPLGDKPGAIPPPVPTNFKADIPGYTEIPLTWEMTGEDHTGFELQQWRYGLPGESWAPALTYPGKDDRAYIADGLPQNTHVGHRIRAVNGNQVSAWAPEVWVDTDYDTGGAIPPAGGQEWAGLTPTLYASTSEEFQTQLAAAMPGDIIGLLPGTYVGTQRSTGVDRRYRPGFEPARSGTADNPITIVARWPAAYFPEPSTRTWLKSGGQKYPNGCPTFGSTSKSYHQWIGLYCYDEDVDGNGMSNDSGQCDIRWSEHHLVSQCVLNGQLNPWHNGGDNYSPIRWEGVRYMHAIDCSMSDWARPGGGQGTIIKLYGCEYAVVEHCYMANAEAAFNPKGWGDATKQMWGNTFRYNHIHNMRRAMTFAQSINEGPNGERNKFHNNLITSAGGFWTQSIHDLPAEYEWGFGCDVYNNTVIGSGSYDQPGHVMMLVNYRPGTDERNNNQFYNNIIYKANAWTSQNYQSSDAETFAKDYAVYDFNCYYNVPYAADTWGSGGPMQRFSWANWQVDEDMNSHFDNPDFEDESGGDYRLKAGSPCRTRGNTGGPQGCYITGDEIIGIR